MRATATFLALLMFSGCTGQTPAPIPTPDPLTDARNIKERAPTDPFLPTRAGTVKLHGEEVVLSDIEGWTLRVARPANRGTGSGMIPGSSASFGVGSLGSSGTGIGYGGVESGVVYGSSEGSSSLVVKGRGMSGSGSAGGRIGTASGDEGTMGAPAGSDDGSGKAYDFTAAEAAPAPKMLKSRRAPVPPPAGSPHALPPRVQSPLKAGSTDDNLKFDAFQTYLDDFFMGAKERGHARYLDVNSRRFLKVEDSSGRPVPGALVQIVDEAADEVIWETYTYGDGRAPLYLPEDNLAQSGYLVEVAHNGTRSRDRWDGRGATPTFSTEDNRPDLDEVALDVVFLIDTTGSMSDEIERIKSTLLSVTEKLRSLEMEFDLRYGAVLYRDVGDEYVTKLHPFTSDIAAFDKALQGVRANGGGDGPESMNQGLFEAVHGVRWRAEAAKLVFLIADAEPHSDYDGDVAYPDVLKDAVSKGIKVHSVAASGLSLTGTVVFRQVAQYTRGEFIFIEYGGSIEATAKWHGVKGKVKSNNLDDILYDKIQEEVALFGSDDSR